MGAAGIRSLCFVAPQAYPVLAGDPSLKVVGGSEVQQSILARELVRRGYRVSMVCMDYGQPAEIEIDGVRVIRAHRPGAGWPRFRTLRAFVGFWAGMARADADLYYQQNCSVLTGYVAAFAKTHHRLAMYCGASDLDFVTNSPLLEKVGYQRIYQWGLRQMDAIAAQSLRQVESCRREFSLDSQVIRSCYGHQGVPGDPSGVVLWAGRIHPAKSPELFVDLARACPEVSFRMVGGGDPTLEKHIHERAAGLSNLVIAGFVPYNQVEPMFDGVAIVVNTSPSEGFPNTFLQGWSRGVPTVSFFDPACNIEGRPVGTVVPSLEAMVTAVRRLQTDREEWNRRSTDARDYFQREFSLTRVADDYEVLFSRLAASRRGN